MGVIDNQINWRRVWPGPGFDVSTWTVAKRMELPDWCFGNRVVSGVKLYIANGPDVDWFISAVNLPASVCFWDLYWFQKNIENPSSYIRLGLRATVPTSVEEMNTAVPILPFFGSTTMTPPKIYFVDAKFEVFHFITRMGMETGELKVVVEANCASGILSGTLGVVYSELPKAIPAFFNPEYVG